MEQRDLTKAPVAAADFAQLLRQHRIAAGLTQADLAERAGLSVHGIQKLERDATHPYRDTAQRLIAALALESTDEARFRSAARPVPRRDRPGASDTPSLSASTSQN